MSAKKVLKETAKVVARTAVGFVGMSAVAAKHGLTITDSVLGGMVNGMANSFAGGMGATPMKDMALKATTGLLNKISGLSKKLDEKIKGL